MATSYYGGSPATAVGAGGNFGTGNFLRSIAEALPPNLTVREGGRQYGYHGTPSGGIAVGWGTPTTLIGAPGQAGTPNQSATPGITAAQAAALSQGGWLYGQGGTIAILGGIALLYFALKK